MSARTARSDSPLCSPVPISPQRSPGRREKSFKDFFEDRDDIKESLYRNVVLYGIAVLFMSASPLFVGVTLLADISNTTRYAFGQFLSVVGGFFFSAGLCAASTVPVSEYDIEKGLNEHPVIRRIVWIALSLFFLAFGCVCTCLPPYAPSAPAVLCALWLSLHEFQLDKWPLLFKVACNTICCCVCATQVFFSLAWLQDAMATNVTSLFTDVGDANTRRVYTAVGSVLGAAYASGIIFTATLCWYKLRPHVRNFSLWSGLELNADIEKKWPGWSTELFYATLYLVLYELVAAFTLNGVTNFMDRSLSPINLVGYVFCSIVFILPPVFLLVYGKDNTFTLLARYFEFDLKRLQQDGALMAYLVSKASSKLHNKQRLELEGSASSGRAGPVWWVKRSVDDQLLVSENPNHIKRCFWAKGEIESIEGIELLPLSASSTPTLAKQIIVQVSMMDDMDSSWAAWYQTVDVADASSIIANEEKKTTVLQIERVAATALKSGAEIFSKPDANGLDIPPRPQLSESYKKWKERIETRHYMHWRETNFGTASNGDKTADGSKFGGSKSVSVTTVLVDEGNASAYFGSTARVSEDFEARRVTLVITIPEKEMTEMEVLNWAKDSDNFRSFNWEDRKLDLFSLSPRQLSSKVEKDMLFSLSHPRAIITNADKLDYFVSHSWEYNGDDTGENKYEKVKEFMEKQRADLKRYPTLWLDKVCINQNDTSQAISVLPIIIGGCKQVLILLSPTYLTRLWCVWELFTLFTFCNKELALQRVVVLPLVDFPDPSQSGNLSTAAASADSTSPPTAASQESLFNKLATFDIDDAHCFDPNEELKLRQVISEIGFDRLNVVFDKLRKNFSEAVLRTRKEAAEKDALRVKIAAKKNKDDEARMEYLRNKKEKAEKRSAEAKERVSNKLWG